MMTEISVFVLLSGCFFLTIQPAFKPIFYEPFDEHFEEGRWIVSQNDDYIGVWNHSKSEGHDDYGLLVGEKAKKYAIVKELDEYLEIKDNKVVLQFEVRMQKGIECGGAYLKYLRPQETGWRPEEFDNKSPYSIMFGPDKCGSTDKVHFIFNHKNPKTGKYIEHHLKNPPSVPFDTLSHVYTAVLRYDNRLLILVDGEVKKKVNLLSYEHFDPPVIPPRTVPDPDDKKPEDWDEHEKIADPDAKKPDDWDEDAPFEIEDDDAVKPEGWLDDEPQEIDDPDASKPEDWDDDEDGEWEAPKVINPKCEMGPGCGKWKRPMKRNPAYKGKWFAPLINNPHYNGVWNPRHISNPEFFDIQKPDFEPIAAIGIEIWTMQDGVLFDNILITRDEETAESYRESTWRPKYRIEKEKQRAEEAALGSSDLFSGFQRWVFDLLYLMADIPLLEAYRPKMIDYIQKGEEQPNSTIGILMSVVVVIFTVLIRLLLGSKRLEETMYTETCEYRAAAETPSNHQENPSNHREKEKSAEKEAFAGPISDLPEGKLD